MGIIRVPKKYYQPPKTQPIDPDAPKTMPFDPYMERSKIAPVKARYLRELVDHNRPLTCEACGWGLKTLWEGILHIHHIRPKTMGGDDSAVNLILLCPNHHAVAHMFIRESKGNESLSVSGKRSLVELLRKFDELMILSE